MLGWFMAKPSDRIPVRTSCAMRRMMDVRLTRGIRSSSFLRARTRRIVSASDGVEELEPGGKMVRIAMLATVESTVA